MSLLSDFYELFQGREDVVFLDRGDKGVTQLKRSEIVSRSGSMLGWVGQHLDPSGRQGNSNGEGAIGIYPLRGGTDCRWICSDFDEGDTEADAFKLANTWIDYGIQAWVETSKSKGHHVWVFINDWCPGIIARRSALWVHQVAQVPAKEVNPKQEITDGYGNCVRLPYWSGRDEGRMEMVGTLYFRPNPKQGPWNEISWGRTALLTRCTVNQLKTLAVKWQPPAPPEPTKRPEGGYTAFRDFSGETTDLNCRDVYKGNADVPAGDRDNTLWAVACYMRGIELELGEAIQVMTEIWNDQVEQPAGNPYPLRVAIDKVRRAYASR